MKGGSGGTRKVINHVNNVSLAHVAIFSDMTQAFLKKLPRGPFHKAQYESFTSLAHGGGDTFV